MTKVLKVPHPKVTKEQVELKVTKVLKVQVLKVLKVLLE